MEKPTTIDCVHFANQRDAQLYFDSVKLQTSEDDPDPLALDEDGNGRACESLPKTGGVAEEPWPDNPPQPVDAPDL